MNTPDQFCTHCLAYLSPLERGDEVAAGGSPGQPVETRCCPECFGEEFAETDREAAERASCAADDRAEALQFVARGAALTPSAERALARLGLGVCHCGRLGELVLGGGGVAACPEHRGEYVSLSRRAS